MREMELWRDKIQLRIRDRIQSSMEKFTRECLQIDSQAESAKDPAALFRRGAMEKIYSRAAELVKKTLDAEGACVMDVSRFEVLETSDSAEGHMSVLLHGADIAESSKEHALSNEEYAKITEFFTRHPDGIVADSVIPSWFQNILPPNIMHALSEYPLLLRRNLFECSTWEQLYLYLISISTLLRFCAPIILLL